MQLLDLSFDNPTANLALDEALLDAVEDGSGEPILRFWESPRYFVALGYTNRAATESDLEKCKKRGIPILRRVTGGGTVLQGRGCVNYAVVDRIERGQSLNVSATNDFVTSRVCGALDALLGGDVWRQGDTDLTWRGRKFSGNAQKRRSHAFLFHGTVLLDFDLELVQEVLRPPSKEPQYREHRSHLDFITNLPLQRALVKEAIARAFDADEMGVAPLERVERLVAQRYSRDEWNFRF